MDNILVQRAPIKNLEDYSFDRISCALAMLNFHHHYTYHSRNCSFYLLKRIAAPENFSVNLDICVLILLIYVTELKIARTSQMNGGVVSGVICTVVEGTNL